MFGIFYQFKGSWVQHGTDYVNRCDAELEAEIFTGLTGRAATIMVRCGSPADTLRAKAMAEIAETERLKLRYA